MNTNMFWKFLVTFVTIIMLAACSPGPTPTPTPEPATTHAISGVAPSGATLSLGGTSTATTTAVSGTYSFTGLADGSYTITPTLPGYTFTPTSQVVTVSGADVSMPAFIAIANPAPTYVVSGSVSGLGAGVTVVQSPGGASTSTNASGGFTFPGLANGSYTMTPMHPGYTFMPISVTAVVNGGDVLVPPLTAIPNLAPTYSISGTASAGVTLNLSGSAIANTTAGADGTYNFANLTNGNYTITPTLAGNTFTPTSQAVVVNDADVSVPAFVAIPNPAPTYSISGAVTGEVLGGVTITVTPGGATTTTDASGNYILSGLVDGGYTVTPSLASKTFTPASASATVSGANVTGVDFVEVIPMLTTGKLLFSGSRGAIGNWAGAIYTQDLLTTIMSDLWGGWQCFTVGCGYVLPGVVTPSRVGGKAVFNGSNIHCLMITSLSLPAPVCAIPESSHVAVYGVFDPSQNADMVVLAQGFGSLTEPYRQHIMVFQTDGTGYYLQVTNSAGDIDSAPVFASTCDKNSTACDILFVRNGTDLLLQTVNPSAGLVVGVPTLFEANVVNLTTNAVNGVRTHSVNAGFTQVAYMKNINGNINICIKPKAGGAERCITEGKDPFWVTDGSDYIMYTLNGVRMAIKSDGTGKVQFPTPANLTFQGYTIDQFPDLVLGIMVMAP